MSRIKPLKKAKHIIRQLKKLAFERLPEEKYYALHKFSKPTWADNEGNLYNTAETPDGVKLRRVWVDVQEHIHNRGRAIKNVFKKYGPEAVQAYFYVKSNKEFMLKGI